MFYKIKNVSLYSNCILPIEQTITLYCIIRCKCITLFQIISMTIKYVTGLIFSIFLIIKIAKKLIFFYFYRRSAVTFVYLFVLYSISLFTFFISLLVCNFIFLCFIYFHKIFVLKKYDFIWWYEKNRTVTKINRKTVYYKRSKIKFTSAFKTPVVLKL